MATSVIRYQPSYSRYYGRHVARGVGIAISSTQISFIIPWQNPKGEVPTLTINESSIVGIGTTTSSSSVDSTRTNKDCVAFLVSNQSTTTNSTFTVRFDFTIA